MQVVESGRVGDRERWYSGICVPLSRHLGVRVVCSGVAVHKTNVGSSSSVGRRVDRSGIDNGCNLHRFYGAWCPLCKRGSRVHKLDNQV